MLLVQCLKNKNDKKWKYWFLPVDFSQFNWSGYGGPCDADCGAGDAEPRALALQRCTGLYQAASVGSGC